MDHAKAYELAIKLQELANRGIGGEATNAAKLLEKLLVEHNLSLDDIDTDSKSQYQYIIARRHRKLFFSIVWNVVKNWDGIYTQKGRSMKYIYINLTVAEQLEITAKFDMYAKSYDEQLQLFNRAFIIKNEIFPAKENTSETAKSKLSHAELMNLFSMVNGIEKTEYVKRLQSFNNV